MPFKIKSFNLVFSTGPLASFSGSMATITLSDGDTTNPISLTNWKTVANGGIVDYSAMIVINANGDTLDFNLGALGNSVGNNILQVTNGEITAGPLVMNRVNPNPLTGLTLNFNNDTVLINGTQAGGFSTGTILPKGVPIPSSLLFFGLGFVGFAVWRYRLEKLTKN